MNGNTKVAAAGSAGAAAVVIVDDAAVGVVGVIGGEDSWDSVMELLQSDIAANKYVLGMALAAAVVALGRAAWRRIRPRIDLDRNGISDFDQGRNRSG